ncbi:MAG TPA: hypothetical protein VFQ00_11565 [Terriglobales bacterium]|nr:hypothetical protein [Terriglobales bacterium]
MKDYKLVWFLDAETARAAAKYPLFLNCTTPASQANGHPFLPSTWNHRVMHPPDWPRGVLRSTPSEIIRQFRARRYTQALAMIVSWGEMWRQPDSVWGSRTLESIEETLEICAQSILSSRSVEGSWEILTGHPGNKLGWSAVLASKTLHFLCRSLGFEDNPPVALDGGVIRKKVWPTFRDSIPNSERPKSWNDDTFEAYCRYMTAIITWASQRSWSTTEIEVTIFDRFDGK